MSTHLRDLFAAQNTEIHAIIIQYLRQQNQSVTPKPQPQPSPVPTPAVDVRQQKALQLVRAGQLNQAFEYVLSASDLNLVVYLCENLRPAELFSIQPCPLQIPVILSLIQQLAVDLTTHQETKYK